MQVDLSIYILFSIVFIGGCTAAFRKKKYVMVLAFIASLGSVSYPYCRIWSNSRYINQEFLGGLSSVCKQISGPDTRILDVKIFDANTKESKVYVVSKWGEGCVSCEMISLNSDGNFGYDTIWSSCGNADGDTFPPYAYAPYH